MPYHSVHSKVHTHTTKNELIKVSDFEGLQRTSGISCTHALITCSFRHPNILQLPATSPTPAVLSFTSTPYKPLTHVIIYFRFPSYSLLKALKNVNGACRTFIIVHFAFRLFSNCNNKKVAVQLVLIGF